MRVGPYEVQAPVGQGGSSAVFRARAPDGRVVAVKLLSHATPDHKARFARERRLLAELGEAQGFVPLLDSGEVNGIPFLVMPFVAGGTLRQRIDSGPFAVGDALSLGRTLARAIARAHERGIVHRDLKPENVLYTAAGRPLVSDLGLAKRVDGEVAQATLSRTGELRGTVGYMAPEQMRDAKTAGPEADVFSLGAILYECLAGEPAFSGGSFMELLGQASSGNFEPLWKKRPDTPRWLASVVERSLAPDPSQRFPDAAALGRALTEEKGARPLRGLRIVAGAAAFALVLGGGALAAAIVHPADKPSPETPEVPPRTVARARALEHAERAIAAVSSLDLTRAESELNEALELDPSCALAITARGRVKWERGDRAAAMADHDLAVRTDPKCSWALINRANGRTYSRDYDGAFADCSRAIEADPGRALAWHTRALVRLARGDVDGVIGDETKALQCDPRSLVAWTVRAQARYLKRDFEGAAADATKAIDVSAAFANAWLYRGFARLRLHDEEGAVADLSHAIELAPNDPKAWELRAGARSVTGDSRGAVADASRSIELDPKVWSAWAVRGTALGVLGDVDRAIADCEHALELEPPPDEAESVVRGLERLRRARAGQ